MMDVIKNKKMDFPQLLILCPSNNANQRLCNIVISCIYIIIRDATIDVLLRYEKLLLGCDYIL
jgi:hypothetical protein